MSRPYDLDEHVRRAIEREQRPRPRRRPEHEQLALFEAIAAVPESTRISSSASLIPDDEMLFSRVVALHSAQK